MRTTLKAFLCFVVSLLLCSAANAATYTVCASGCDQTTIAGAFSAYDLAGDDIVEVRADAPGGSKTYSETITPGANDGGSVGHPVTIKARAGDNVTVSGTTYGVDTTPSQTEYFTIDGFTFTDTSSYVVRLGVAGGSETYSVPTAKGLTIQNCTISGNSNQGILLGKTDGALVKNNTITSVSGDVNSQSDAITTYRGGNNIIDNNTLTILNGNDANHIDGVQAGWELNLTVRNNYIEQNNASTSNKQFIFTENGEGWVQIYNNVLYKSTGSTGSNALIVKGGSVDAGVYNNTLDISSANSGIYSTTSGSVNIQNNIVKLGNNTAGIWLGGGTQTKTGVHHNDVLTGQANAWRDATAFYTMAQWGQAGDINSDPDLGVNHAPNVGSVAIDNGADLSAYFTTDILGNTRSGTWDIGAYESGVSDSTPSAFTFTDQTGVALGSTNNSDNQAVAGIDNTTTLVLTGDASCKYSINGAAWATANDNITVGDNVALQNVASGAYSTTVSCTLNLGGVTDTWSRTTLAAVSDPVAPRFRGSAMSGGWR